MKSFWLILTAIVGGVTAQAAVEPATSPDRSSVTAAGHSYSPSFSPDGRYIAFISHASNLVTNDDIGPWLNLYLRDRMTSNTVLISISTNGVSGANDNVGNVSLSAAAQRVAYDTAAGNLSGGDDNHTSDVYVCDLSTRATILASVNASGEGPGNAPSCNPLISSDGRFVVFESLASNLVTNDFNGTNDVFIRDLLLGTTALVSVNAEGTAAADGSSHSPSLSADGRIVAFVSHATNLVAGVTNRLGEIYVRDTRSGTQQWATASHLVSTWSRGQASGLPLYYQASEPALSADGRFVMFKTSASTVRLDRHRPLHSISQIYTNLLGVDSFGFDDNPRLVAAAYSALADDSSGRYLAFDATNSAPGFRGIVRVEWETLETNILVIARGVHTNVGPAVEFVVTNALNPGTPIWTRLESIRYSVPGQRLLFLANGNGLVPTATNSTRQVYTVDLATRDVRLVSTNRAGLPGPDLGGIVPSLSADGSMIAWDSPDAEVVDGDENASWDVFAITTSGGNSIAVSTAHPDRTAYTATGMSRQTSLSFSADGRYVGFVSTDSTLVDGDGNRGEDIFVCDTHTGVKTHATPGKGGRTNAELPILSKDGRFLAYSFQRRDINVTNRSVYWADLITRTNREIASFVLPPDSPPAMTPDGRFMAFNLGGDFIRVTNIYMLAMTGPVDGPPRVPVAVSTTPGNLTLGSSSSIRPAFSPDGTWIIFQSRASDLISEYPVVSPEFQLYARKVGCDQAECAPGYLDSQIILGPTRLVSAGVAIQGRDQPMAGGGMNPVFSANSRYVAFESRLSSIIRHDLNAPWVATRIEENGIWITNYSRDANVLVCTNCSSPSLDGNGTLAVFEERLPSGTNIVARNLVTGQREWISQAPGGAPGNGPSFGPTVSHDGRFVLFTSLANDLVPRDSNGVTDIYLRDRWNGITHCLSQNWRGTGTGNRASSRPVLAANGRTIGFHSLASDLIPGDYNDRRDVFVTTIAGTDSDGDGMDDDLEMAYFNTLARTGVDDFDSDGMSDASELRSGTNPADGNSVFGVLVVTTALFGETQGMRMTALTWRTTPGHRYRLQYRASLGSLGWEDIGSEVISQGTTATEIHPVFEAMGFSSAGFYRVRLLE